MNPMIARADACPVCGGRHLKSLNPIASDLSDGQRITVVECRDCTFAWQYPLARTTGDSVASATSRSQDAAGHGYYDPAQRRRVAELQVDFIAGLLGRRADASEVRLLDVGAGAGTLAAAAARRGWTATGLDPAAPAPSTGGAASLLPGDREGLGRATLVRGTLDGLDSATRFDLVTLMDVIEHLVEPSAVVRQAAEYVAPDGILVIETANYQSGARIAAGEAWWCFAADHRWYFGPDSLARCGRAAGGHLRRLARRPHTMLSELARWHAENDAARRWPQWSGLEIFTISARRPIAA